MLDKIETLYLSAMRVLVLIAATIALLVAVFGTIASAPVIAGKLGFKTAPAVGTPDLRAFIQEQRAAGRSVGVESDDTSAKIVTSAKVSEAARVLSAYLRDRSKDPVVEKIVAEALQSQADEINVDHREAFEDSLLSLATQLKNSKGAPLSVDQVDELLTWNQSRFKEALATREAEEMAENARGVGNLMVTGVALLAFLIILFFFVFVKIERNLRLVKTREVAP